jgi:hypothetical protein
MLLVPAAASEVADFAVAGGTAALAIATFLMAWSARKQATATRRLAQASERQVAWMAQQGIAATIPSLHIKLVALGSDQWGLLVDQAKSAQSGATPSMISIRFLAERLSFRERIFAVIQIAAEAVA